LTNWFSVKKYLKTEYTIYKLDTYRKLSGIVDYMPSIWSYSKPDRCCVRERLYLISLQFSKRKQPGLPERNGSFSEWFIASLVYITFPQ
jgi:hypothetical protein